MKHRFVITLSVIVVMLVAVAAFGIGRASASTGCFNDTNGNWAEPFICWMKDNGISSGTGGGAYSPNTNVTRAQMAVFMARQAEIPPSTGDIYINTGPSGWIKEYVSLAELHHRAGYAEFATSESTDSFFLLSPSLPSGLYGREVFAKGVKLCYEAGDAQMTQVTLSQYAGDGSLISIISDSTIRTDKTCRSYMFPGISAFLGGDQLTLEVAFHTLFPGTPGSLRIYSTTFIMSPSADPAILAPAGARPIFEGINP